MFEPLDRRALTGASLRPYTRRQPPRIRHSLLTIEQRAFWGEVVGGHLEMLVFRRCLLKGVSFAGLHLTGVTFVGCDLHACDFSDAILSHVAFEECRLSDCLFERTHVSAVAIRDSIVQGCDLSSTDLVDDEITTLLRGDNLWADVALGAGQLLRLADPGVIGEELAWMTRVMLRGGALRAVDPTGRRPPFDPLTLSLRPAIPLAPEEND